MKASERWLPPLQKLRFQVISLRAAGEQAGHDAVQVATRKRNRGCHASNDPAKMRAALDRAEKALNRINDHMNNCMGMLNIMQNMGDMMSGKGERE